MMVTWLPVFASQNARVDPAMPAPHTSTSSWDILEIELGSSLILDTGYC